MIRRFLEKKFHCKLDPECRLYYNQLVSQDPTVIGWHVVLRPWITGYKKVFDTEGGSNFVVVAVKIPFGQLIIRSPGCELRTNKLLLHHKNKTQKYWNIGGSNRICYPVGKYCVSSLDTRHTTDKKGLYFYADKNLARTVFTLDHPWWKNPYHNVVGQPKILTKQEYDNLSTTFRLSR